MKKIREFQGGQYVLDLYGFIAGAIMRYNPVPRVVLIRHSCKKTVQNRAVSEILWTVICSREVCQSHEFQLVLSQRV